LADTFQERVEVLCNQGMGDRERLQRIIKAIKEGKKIHISDMEYVDKLEKDFQT